MYCAIATSQLSAFRTLSTIPKVIFLFQTYRTRIDWFVVNGGVLMVVFSDCGCILGQRCRIRLSRDNFWFVVVVAIVGGVTSLFVSTFLPMFFFDIQQNNRKPFYIVRTSTALLTDIHSCCNLSNLFSSLWFRRWTSLFLKKDV